MTNSEKLNPEKQDFSLSMGAANIYSLMIAVPLFALQASLYMALWGMDKLQHSLVTSFKSPLFIAILVAGIIAHELLHAAGWLMFGQVPRAAIKFGFHIKTLTPYAHCTGLLDIRTYRIGGLLPGLVLGFIPAGLGILTGYGPLISFGLLFSLAASGDLLSLWLLRNVPPGSLVEDHPSRVGCYIITGDLD